MSFYRSNWIKSTKKTRRCIWCHEWIKSGTTCYYFAAMSMDNDFNYGHMHPECAAAADEVLVREHYWEPSGAYARGRIDYDTSLPPIYLPSYRGKDRKQHMAATESVPSVPSVS